LEAKGMIRRAERGSRQIDLAQAAPPATLHALPMFGSIPAGPPQHFQAGEAESTPVFDEEVLGFRPRQGCFVLKVRGDSMRDAGILNGDSVVIEPNPSPHAGQIVAALIDGECTLKRLVKVRDNWFLKAENPAYPELHPRADLVIQGVVRTVVRRLD
jgi:repressor LexA